MPEPSQRSPERQPERRTVPDTAERAPFPVERSSQETTRPVETSAQPAPSSIPASGAPAHVGTLDPFTRDVEAVLEEGMGDLYRSLDEATQQQFRQRGEEAASAIAMLLQRAKVQVRAIIRLIVAWLRVIPGVSSLFAEQEAKIKTDRLLGLRREREKRNP